MSDGIGETLLLGAMTGVRSMSGAAALARARGGALGGATALLALGEMIADKTPVVGARIDPLPLAGRAVMGAVVGAAIAHETDANRLFGALLGASAAVAAAHIAYHLRTRAPMGNMIAGLLEDAAVVAAGAGAIRRWEER
jgi:uncharacterized membrane protein